jgi:hypothetical protein
MDLELDPEQLPDGEPIVADPAELSAAERAVAGMRPTDAYDRSDEEWVELVGRRRVSGLFGEAGYTAAIVTAPLQAADIPFMWDPYPPEQMPAFRVGYGAVDRPFTLLVPASRLAEAQALLDTHTVVSHTAPPTSDVLHLPPRADGTAPSPPAEPPQESRPLQSDAVDQSRMVIRVVIWLMIIATFVTYVIARS